MTRSPRRFALAATTVVLAAAPGWALAHDDDPKILDRKAPVGGAGFRASLAGPGGGTQARGAFGSRGFELGAWLTLSDLGVPSANGTDCWGYVSPTGREYALMGTTEATVVVEVTNPGAPTVTAVVDGFDSAWRDLKVYGDTAYAVTEGGGGLQVIDLAGIDSGNVSVARTVTGHGTDATHNVAIDETSGYLYRTGGGNLGLRVYDLSVPSDPVLVGAWSTRYVHDAQVVTYASGPFAGRQVAYCCTGFNGGFDDPGLTVLDVTDKANITVLAQLSYPGGVYSHQGWLSEDRSLFYLGDEFDEGDTVGVTTTHVFDVADPASVSYVGAFENESAAVGHNMYTAGGLLFQANYTSGLRVFDCTADPETPAEVAFFDTAPDSAAPIFNGAWSVYPYLPSGTVVVSDIERGLFVLEPAGVVVSGGTGAGPLDPSGAEVTVGVRDFLGRGVDAGSVQLWYDAGAGFVALPLAPGANAGEFSGTLPALPCGTLVRSYVEAADASGRTSTFPALGASAPAEALVGDTVTEVVAHDMELGGGWTGGVAGDTASSGVWERVAPIGTQAAPSLDHSKAGSLCWVTGQGTDGGSLGENDVDGGRTTLLSPALDLGGLTDPRVSYWRWYSNDTGGTASDDVFDVAISNDDGATWTALESIGPTGPGTSAGWNRASFRIADFVAPTSAVRLRFVASDTGSGSIVEAAIDDLRVADVACSGGPGVQFCTANPNSTGAVGTIAGSGSDVASDGDLTLVAAGLPPFQFGLFVVSRDAGFVPGLAGGQGNLCLGGALGRYTNAIASSGAAGEITVDVDLAAIPQGLVTAAVQPGDTWRWQCWHRDVGVTSNLTRGYAVTFR